MDSLVRSALIWIALVPAGAQAEDWPQLKFDARHSGDAPQRRIELPLRLAAAVPLDEAIFTAPAVADGRVYVVDGSGTAWCLAADSLKVLWRVPTAGGPANCNNVSSPAVAGRYLHFGTMAGGYYVLDKDTGAVVRRIACGEPIFSAPVVGADRVYFATLGARVYALEFDGQQAWQWDYVGEQLGFRGERFDGAAWLRQLGHRVTLAEQFLCSRDIALDGRSVVLPAGGAVVWLEDQGSKAVLRRLHLQHTATLALSVGPDGTVYRQWHWLDNMGQVDRLRPGAAAPGEVLRPGESVPQFERKLETALRATQSGRHYLPGTRSDSATGLLSFASVSLRGSDVYRCGLEEPLGFCRHAADGTRQAYEGCYPSIAAPLLAGDKALYGGLDGALYVVPLEGGPAWSFRTPWGKPISAPAAVADGRVYFGGEGGYLYALAPGGTAPTPSRDLELWRVRSPLAGSRAAAPHDRYTSFHDWGNTNFDDQPLALPVKFRWIRRYEGTVKHFSTFGGGRMYTHTAEGQVFAVEQQTGRLLWRRYFPGVFVSYTAPLYDRERLLVPQAGRDACRLRCFQAATGELLWEAPFSGSPSWNRQQPPVISKNLAIYMFGSGRYDAGTPEKDRVKWLFGHQNIGSFPASHAPLLRAYDLDTGREVWTRDFRQYGSGGDDAGACLLDGRLYYSCFFGRTPRTRAGEPGPQGVTAALDPQTGRVDWVTTDYSLRGGCTISGQDGRLYLGGYNPTAADGAAHVWCLNAKDGSLVWQSPPLHGAIKVVSLAPQFVFAHSQYQNAYLLDKADGRILATTAWDCKCTAFTLSGACLLGPGLDVWDLSDVKRIGLLVSGPRLDPSECVGSYVSNGRIYYTGNGGGLQCCRVCGAEAAAGEKPE